MRSSSLVALWAAVASAQSTVTVVNLLYNDTTLTFKGSDASATTYYHACSVSTGSVPSISTATASRQGAGTLTLLPLTGPPTNFPTQTAKARLRRDSSDDLPCELYTIVQGPSTYQFHLTDAVPGAFTYDLDCKFGNGGVLSGDGTCSGTADGSDAGPLKGTTTGTFPHSMLSSIDAFVTANVVSATDTATPAGSGSGSSSGSSKTPAASASGSGTKAPGAQSTGLAASVPLPTGAIALVGGAAGILAAVIAL
ncbi:hypothetical protein BCR34DRAFT_578215 [Clohesyomyces aquaticus]|uniref:Ser-Thr-rich glycosyl-phosphatidyl-inositol-anchored membrane family-domain-containing protein n=1 Tax=Clohesyomyces aquaticus TaxID=1231657 RepID=A0A1Y1YHA1_9PLEO|nr:hypothetical protein BCR34DRAFT_578215 [Clohesyomyces aquaticus]